MTLSDYLKQARGLAASLARTLGVTPVTVSQWGSGARQVPAERCPDIERATGGVVICEELRPDVDWAYIRQPSRQLLGIPDARCTAAEEDPDANRIVPVPEVA